MLLNKEQMRITQYLSTRQQLHRDGFTIVELLIIIVVLAIIAALSVVAYNGVQERARVASAESDLHTLHQAITPARVNADATLHEITQQNCTGCVHSSDHSVETGDTST